jgi:hypothetical protein
MMWAIGEDPGVVSEETGHSDGALTFSTYRQARRFSPDEKGALLQLVEGAELALIGTPGDFETVEHPQAKAA